MEVLPLHSGPFDRAVRFLSLRNGCSWAEQLRCSNLCDGRIEEFCSSPFSLTGQNARRQRKYGLYHAPVAVDFIIIALTVRIDYGNQIQMQLERWLYPLCWLSPQPLSPFGFVFKKKWAICESVVRKMGFISRGDALVTFVPILVYWVASGIYTFLGRFERYRIYPRDDENPKNPVSRSQVIKGVVLQQAIQATASLIFSKASPLSPNKLSLIFITILSFYYR